MAPRTITKTSPEDMRRKKIVKKGFQLCLMVIGQSGTGKTTFINTLCEGKVRDSTEVKPIPPPTMEIRAKTVPLGEDDGTTINLTVVDTPGFGDHINNEDNCDAILKYLESKFDDILKEERRVNRNPKFEDERVHVALYFISPTGHGLRELDIDLMRNLSARANVIPVIAKADTLTSQELQHNKEAIMRDITHFNIPIYYFPCDEEDDDETIQECIALRELVPFAVVGGNEIFHINDEYFRGREYPWGFVRVDDPDQSDFAALRSVLFGSHLTEFREITHDILYEKYRTEKLSANEGSIPFSPDITVDDNMLLSGGSNVSLEENKRKEYEENLQRQLEQKRQEVNRHEEYLRQIKASLPRKE